MMSRREMRLFLFSIKFWATDMLIILDNLFRSKIMLTSCGEIIYFSDKTRLVVIVIVSCRDILSLIHFRVLFVPMILLNSTHSSSCSQTVAILTLVTCCVLHVGYISSSSAAWGSSCDLNQVEQFWLWVDLF